jgi:hypothetical protein
LSSWLNFGADTLTPSIHSQTLLQPVQLFTDTERLAATIVHGALDGSLLALFFPA